MLQLLIDQQRVVGVSEEKRRPVRIPPRRVGLTRRVLLVFKVQVVLFCLDQDQLLGDALCIHVLQALGSTFALYWPFHRQRSGVVGGSRKIIT